MNLTFSNVTLEYPGTTPKDQPVRALNGLNLDIPHGQAVSIIGPSGCGKSTALRLAAGLLAPTSGEVLIDGQPLAKPRQDTALILQDFGLLPWYTVFHNAELGLKIAGVPAAERTKRTQEALKRVGLDGFQNNYPAELSGGMQQRLALARAIAADVQMLLMDEPLSALDALLREDLQNTLLELWQQNHHTQVLVTHSIEEAVFLGQRIVVMAPRPSRVVALIDNPSMGSADYRKDDIFFQQCKQVRAALAQAAGEAHPQVAPSSTATEVPHE